MILICVLSKESHAKGLQRYSPDNTDEFVVLGEHTKYPPIKWRFPDTTHCPKVYCNRWFDSRYAARLHYCKDHAKNDLLCKICKTLISMTGENNLVNHYQRKHPSDPIPMPTSSASTEVSQCSNTDTSIRMDQNNESNDQTQQNDADQSVESEEQNKKLPKRIVQRRKNVHETKKSTTVDVVAVSLK